MLEFSGTRAQRCTWLVGELALHAETRWCWLISVHIWYSFRWIFKSIKEKYATIKNTPSRDFPRFLAGPPTQWALQVFTLKILCFTVLVFNHLVVEETDVLLHKGDAQLLGRLEDGGVVLAATRRGNVLGA